MKQKIINFKYYLNKMICMVNKFLIKNNKEKLLIKLKKIKKRVKQSFSNTKFKLNRAFEIVAVFLLKILKFIINIDVSFLFLFAATYLFNFTYPWEYRLIGCFGIIQVYKILKNDFKRYL